ncbi:MAG: preprotein translocase subunit YajC [Deltaproteobacteria bacterium]|nr:preprotein translocase subunit YajC [Deltaproteobacteria bacterium]MBI3294348.1 preprotein translocase subunit YajC [Deltaproteobacteria bacterium]
MAESTPASASPNPLTTMAPMLIIFGIFYFLVLRPQSKKQKDHATFLKDIKKGDMVVTNGGIIGLVKNLSEKIVTLEIDNGVCLKVLRGQIAEAANTLKEEKA